MRKERVHNDKEARALVKEALRDGTFEDTQFFSHAGEYLFSVTPVSHDRVLVNYHDSEIDEFYGLAVWKFDI